MRMHAAHAQLRMDRLTLVKESSEASAQHETHNCYFDWLHAHMNVVKQNPPQNLPPRSIECVST